MREHIAKAFKWLISVSCFILGVYCVSLTEGGANMKPVFPALMSFGVVFWLSSVTYGANKTLCVITVIVLMITGCLARFVIQPVLAMDFYLIWFFVTAILGTPFMVYAFKKYGD